MSDAAPPPPPRPRSGAGEPASAPAPFAPPPSAPPVHPGPMHAAPPEPAGAPTHAAPVHAAPPRPATPPPPDGGNPKSGGIRVAVWVTIIAAVAIAAGIVWSLVLIVSDSRTAPADPGDTGAMHPLEVVSGMCLETMPEDGAVNTVEVVDCRQGHTGEVLGSHSIPLSVYPGDADVVEEAGHACRSIIDHVAPEVDTWTAWVPSEDSWRRGDRTVLCIATSDVPVEGSASEGRGEGQSA